MDATSTATPPNHRRIQGEWRYAAAGAARQDPLMDLYVSEGQAWHWWDVERDYGGPALRIDADGVLEVFPGVFFQPAPGELARIGLAGAAP